jgi:O-antigen ligase
MRVFINYLILSLYFFVYVTPQYYVDFFLAFDRVYPQMFIISVINIIAFTHIIKIFNFKEFVSTFKHKKHFLSFFFVVIISTTSLLVTDNFTEGLVALVKLFNLFLAYCFIIIIAFSRNFNIYNYFIIVTVLSLFIESVIINYQVIESVIINGNLLGRSNIYAGFGANINISSFSVLIKSIVPIYLLFNYKNRIIKLISCFLLASSFLTVMLLMSRAAIIALFLVFISILLLSVFANKKKYYFASGLVILSLFISMFSYNIINEKNAYNIIGERFSNVTNPMVDGSVNERLSFYTTSARSIIANPILGIGIGNWKIKSIDLSKDIIKGYRVPYFVHNDFLQTAAEIGILGGLCFVFYILYPFWISFKKTIKHLRFNLDFMIFLIFSVYTVDSMLNFPFDRPINVIYLFFTIILFYKSEKYYLK